MCKSALSRPTSQTEWPYKKETSEGDNQDTYYYCEYDRSFSRWDGRDLVYINCCSGSSPPEFSPPYLQLVVPTLLKSRGQVLVGQAAQEVQEVCNSSLCGISHRPGRAFWWSRGGLWVHESLSLHKILFCWWYCCKLYGFVFLTNKQQTVITIQKISFILL